MTGHERRWPVPLNRTVLGLGRPRRGLDVFEQGHEAEIHMQLLMTVEQREAGIIRHKVDLHLLVAADHDNILDDTGRWLPSHTCQFETVTMKVDRMDVVAGVAHAQPVPFAVTYAKHWMHRLHPILRKREIVDRPPVETTLGCVLLGKDHFDDLIRLWNRSPGFPN